MAKKPGTGCPNHFKTISDNRFRVDGINYQDKIVAMSGDHQRMAFEKWLAKQQGKKVFDRGYRPARTMINLQFKSNEIKKKQKEKLTVKQEILDEFERRFSENCNQILMRKKHKSVSPDSPFDKNNLPPRCYLVDDKNIKEKPNKIELKDYDVSQMPLAGRLSEVGQKILTLGSKQALYITTGPWHDQAPQSASNSITNNDDSGSLTKRGQHRSRRVPVVPNTVANQTPASPRNVRPVIVDHEFAQQLDSARSNSQSPTQIRMTKDRVEFLKKAKASRNARREQRLSISGV